MEIERFSEIISFEVKEKVHIRIFVFPYLLLRQKKSSPQQIRIFSYCIHGLFAYSGTDWRLLAPQLTIFLLVNQEQWQYYTWFRSFWDSSWSITVEEVSHTWHHPFFTNYSFLGENPLCGVKLRELTETMWNDCKNQKSGTNGTSYHFLDLTGSLHS